MKEYKRILKSILKNGRWKENRTGTRCLTTFCEVFRHNMNDGFPLLTTKKMAYRSILVELEGFIKGITNKKWFQERNCKIWNEWANPVKVKEVLSTSKVDDKDRDSLQAKLDLGKKIQFEETDLGPIYGYQWRNFGQHCGSLPVTINEKYPTQRVYHPNGVNDGFDQLQRIIDTLKTNPNDRRMVCSAWNPNQEHMQALPPCHVMWNVVHINGVLNLCWFQRSIDTGRGLPFNIASYALLLLLLCKESNLKPGILHGTLSDCHIYEDQIIGIKEQLNREPYMLPNIIIPDTLKSGKTFSIFDWTHEDFSIENYTSWPKLELGSIAV